LCGSVGKGWEGSFTFREKEIEEKLEQKEER
jgi:hypothetical protein